MSDSNDNNNPDAASRVDDLVATIRNALATDASSESRATAASACRAILGVLDPTTRSNLPPSAPSPTSTASAATSPLASALGAIGQIPKEQLLGFLVGGLKSLMSQSGPNYLTAPVRVIERAAEGEHPAAPARTAGSSNSKRGGTR
jgi:hypothetical protein